MVKKTKKLNLIKPVTERPLYQLPSDQKLLERFNSLHPKVQEAIRYFCEDTTEKILKNMYEMGINTEKGERNGVEFSGKLRRSIHWNIVNNAGGDGALIEFYYLKYGDYLGIGASGWLNKQYGPIKSGMVPQMYDISPVQIGNRPWGAKPFLKSEIRRKAQKLTRRLARQFAFQGGMMIFQSLSPEADNQQFADGFKDYVSDEVK